MSAIQELVGVKVVKSEWVEDYLQVWFENEHCLNVYNKHQITSSDGRPQSYHNLVSTTLKEVRHDGTFIRLIFSNELELAIDMSEDAYLGPEALQLTRPGLPIVVWRIDD